MRELNKITLLIVVSPFVSCCNCSYFAEFHKLIFLAVCEGAGKCDCLCVWRGWGEVGEGVGEVGRQGVGIPIMTSFYFSRN